MSDKKIDVTEFLDDKYKEFSIYTIHNRAIPSITDGLKPVQRRVLWVAMSQAKGFIKVADLAGKTICIHPHGDASISSAIGNMTQDFCGANNHPLFQGKGAFGSKVKGPGKGIGAPRYVSIKLSDFTKQTVFKDLNLVKEIPNYDGEYIEAEHFLPLVPMCLVNGVSGIAVGFATEILPYKLEDIIKVQEQIMNGDTKIKELVPYFKGFNGKIVFDKELGKYKTIGILTKKDNLEIRITELPIGLDRDKYKKFLNGLVEKGHIKDSEDWSKKEYDFRIKCTRKTYNKTTKQLQKLFRLEGILSENITLIDANNKLKIYNNALEVVEEFTKWRFTYIKKRYEKYFDVMSKETTEKEELLKFIKFVVKENYVKKMITMSKENIKKTLQKQFPNINKMLGYGIQVFSQDSILDIENEIKGKIVDFSLIGIGININLDPIAFPEISA